MNFVLSLCVALLSLAPQQRVVAPGTAILQGMVVDAATQAPLAGARAWIVDLNVTTRTGSDGRFVFEHLPAGTFTVTVSQDGYTFDKRTIELTNNSLVGFMFPLAQNPNYYIERVDVLATEAPQPKEPGVVAQTAIGASALQSLRSIATDDPMRAVQALPGATTGDDFRSEFSVRGASFRQMGVVIDGIATPMLVHTIKGHDDTGSIAMINTDVLDSASLMAGAHPQRDGNWLGGTLKFTVREGSRDQRHVRVAASDTGAAAVLEGPIGKSRKGSWLFSARKSYAAWLIRKIDPTFGSTLDFYDMQSKAGYDLTAHQRVEVLAIGGSANYFQENTGLANGLRDANSRSIVGSAVWRYRAPTFELSQRFSNGYSDFKNFGLLGQNQGDGITKSRILRTDLRWLASRSTTMEGGAQHENTHDQRTLRTYSATSSSAVRLRSEDTYSGSRGLSSAWAQVTAKTKFGGLVAGARGITDQIKSAPYGSWWVLGGTQLGTRVSVQGGVSRTVQFADLYQTFYAPVPLTPERAMSYDLGTEVEFTSGISVRVNGYRRNETDILRVYNHEPRVVNGRLIAAALPSWKNALTGTSRGAEFVLQRKASTGLVGWVSYGYGHTRYDDTLTGESFDGDFDQRHTVNAFLEQRLSPRAAVSLKVRTGSSPPIPGYLRGTVDALFISDARNQVRLPTYLRIDARANRTFTVNQRRLTLFLEVINLTGRRNYGIAEGSVRTATTGFQANNWTEKLIPWLPSIGILFEF